jgi:hypothetical protein
VVWGVNAYDAEKTLPNSDDDLMCWAAAASNILAWSGWGFPTGESFRSEDDIFGYYQKHWSDQGGLMEYAWDWWFDGTNPSQGWNQAQDDDPDSWSQVNVSGGGGFWDPAYAFSDYFLEDWSDYYDSTGNAMSTIDSYLHSGYGTTLAIYKQSGGGHAITVWGFDYDIDDQGQITYNGLWVTDSDDDKGSDAPPDTLRYYDVSLSSGRWHLQSYRGKDQSPSGNWYIGGVQALRPPERVVPEPADQVAPEPGTLFLLGLGLIGVIALKRRTLNK